MTTIIIQHFPVSVNELYANVPGKGRVKSKRYRTWANAAGWDVRAQRPKPIRGRYAITMELERKPDRRRRDLQNFLKCVSDLLVELGVIEDDHLEEEVVLRWSDAVKGCRVELVSVEQRSAVA